MSEAQNDDLTIAYMSGYADGKAAERLAQQAQAGWQDIATAPKDGVVFLIGYEPSRRMDGSRRVYEARWNEVQERFTSVNGFLLFDGATYWQPLPAAPQQGSKI